LVVPAGIFMRRMASPSSFICARCARARASNYAKRACPPSWRWVKPKSPACPFRAPALEAYGTLGTLRDELAGHGLRHRQRCGWPCAAVCTLMGACGYRAFENTAEQKTDATPASGHWVATRLRRTGFLSAERFDLPARTHQGRCGGPGRHDWRVAGTAGNRGLGPTGRRGRCCAAAAARWQALAITLLR